MIKSFSILQIFGNLVLIAPVDTVHQLTSSINLDGQFECQIIYPMNDKTEPSLALYYQAKKNGKLFPSCVVSYHFFSRMQLFCKNRLTD